MLVAQNSIILDTSKTKAVSKKVMDANDIIALVQSGKRGRDHIIEQYFKDKELKNSVRYLISKENKHLLDEVFTDAILAFITSCSREGFTVKSSIKNYIITAARNIYFKQIRVTSAVTSIEDQNYFEFTSYNHLENIEGISNLNDRSQIVLNAVSLLDEKCKELLTRWANNTRMREIALRLDYKSEGMARKKKFQCIQKLKSYFIKNTEL